MAIKDGWRGRFFEDRPGNIKELTGRVNEIPASGSWLWVRLDPSSNPAEVFRLKRGGVG